MTLTNPDLLAPIVVETQHWSKAQVMSKSEDSFWSYRLALTVLMTGLITIAIVYVTRFSLTLWSGALDESPSRPVSRELIELSLGNLRLAVPGNMLSQNDDSEGTDRIEIALLWPELTGRRDDNAEQFADRSSQSRVIRLQLARHSEPIGTEERFTRILRPAIDGAPLPGPDGLTGQRFRPGTGFGPDVLYFGPATTSARYLIFCSEPFDQAPQTNTAFCQRLIQVAPDLRLEITFRPALLQDWRSIDEKVTTLVQGFLVTD
jgi:hypothetical protein